MMDQPMAWLSPKTLFSQLSDDVKAVFDRDPAARNTLEVVLTYPGVHAVVLHRLAHQLWQGNYRGSARGLAAFSRFLTGIEIHPGARIGRRFFIDHGMGTVIGETVEIGDDVTLYQGVTLGGTTWQKGKRHPTLEDGVIVGAGAKVLGPFTVGRGAKIGSNAVVTKPVPAGATALGTAARLIIKQPGTAAVQQESQRQAYAASIGFAPYAGASPDLPDPLLDAIRTLLDHMQKTDTRLERVAAALCDMNPAFCDQKVKPICEQDMPVVRDHASRQ